MIGQTIGEAIAGGISGNGGTTGDGESIFDKIGDGLSAVGDFLGFDGNFGYQGPDERNLSLAGLGDAFEGAANSLFGGGETQLGSAGMTMAETALGGSSLLGSTTLMSPRRQAELLRSYAETLRGQGAQSMPTGGDDPMDGADMATFGEGLAYEFSRGGYRRALDAVGDDPDARMRVALNRAMRAEQAFGRFSGEEVQRVYAEEMQTRRGRTTLGGTDLSEIALEHRRTARDVNGNAISHERNVAVFEYLDPNGQYTTSNGQRVSRIAVTSEGGDRHAEWIAVNERLVGIAPERVTRIYSDRAPCGPCADALRPYSGARVTWAVDWPNDRPGRTAATARLGQEISRYRADQGAGRLPDYQWRSPRTPGTSGPEGTRRRRRT